MADTYRIRRLGPFRWELTVSDENGPFSTRIHRTRRSAERTILWHRAYKHAARMMRR